MISKIFFSLSMNDKLRRNEPLANAEQVYDESFPIQYIIKSKHGKDIRAYNQNEKEVLFKRNSRFWITKVEGNTIYMEEA